MHVDFALYENKANNSWSGNMTEILRSEHLSVECFEMKLKEEQGITELLGGVKSDPGKRDGLNQTRQSSQPAQQELPLFI